MRKKESGLIRPYRRAVRQAASRHIMPADCAPLTRPRRVDDVAVAIAVLYIEAYVAYREKK